MAAFEVVIRFIHYAIMYWIAVQCCFHQNSGNLEQVSRDRKQFKARVVDAPARGVTSSCWWWYIASVTTPIALAAASSCRFGLLPHEDTRSHHHRSRNDRQSRQARRRDDGYPQGPTTPAAWFMIVRRKENIEFSAE